MKYRKLGNTGAYVSSLSLGTMFYGGAQWQATPNPVTKEEALTCLSKAYDLGINYIDCADLYGAYGNAEKIIGEFLKDHERSDFFISSKTFLPMSKKPNDAGLSRKHIFESVDKSLDRLGTDHIDLYYAHRYDFATPLEETVVAMNDLIKMGKINYWGTSNWESNQLERAYGIANRLGLQGPVVDQAKYSMLLRYSAEVELPYTMNYYSLGIVAYKVLADAVLTSIYSSKKSISELNSEQIALLSRYSFVGTTTEEKAQNLLTKLNQIDNIAKEIGVTMSQLALAWILQKKNISSAIVSSRNPARLEENVGSLDIKVDKDLNSRLTTILANEPSPDPAYKGVSYWYHKPIVQNGFDEESAYPPKPDKF